jgi:hypothetical protein
VFSKYLEDESTSLNTLLNGQCHKGLRQAIKERRWRSHIAQAVALIDHEGATTHSLAVLLSAEFSRLERTHRAPTTPLAKALLQALSAHPGGGTSVNALWVVVDSVRQTPP